MSGTSALTGAMIGTLIPMRNYLRGLTDDVDENERRSRASKVRLDNVETKLIDLLDSGDIIRLSSDRASDFLGGVTFGRAPKSEPSVSVITSVPNARPAFSEEWARTAGPWPGAANEYTPSGLFKDPERAFDVSNLARVGLALGFEEVHALLTGVCLPQRPTAEGAVSMYRVFQGLARAASRLALSQDRIEAIWAAFFGPSLAGAIGSKLLDVITADSANVGATGAEEAIGGGLLVPAGCWPVGRTVCVDAGFFLPSANGTDTMSLKFRVGPSAGLGGALFFSSTTGILNPGNSGDQIFAKLYLCRRADVGGVPQVAGYATLQSIGGAAGVSETIRLAQVSLPALGLGGSAISGAVVVQPSVLFSAANAANLIRQEYGTTFLQ